MKNLFTFAIVALALSFTACNNEGTTETEAVETETVETEAPVVEEEVVTEDTTTAVEADSTTVIE
ncbi:hypothetical protein [Pontibacter litorisediminis]|uniref:hypothetical protein n=1 Tax=Pontibacter litorisediminis TaxID=1846260 RepID=UPI0023ED2452|nr:hypothetical protein [Pontibacter litorisediminis]